MSGSTDIPLRWLADYVDGVLGGPRLERVEEALGEEDTAVRLDRLRATVERLADGPLDAPPPEVERRAVALFQTVHGGLVWPPPGVLVGELVADHGAGLVGVRSGGETRRLVWTLDGYDVDSSFVRTDRGIDLLGQFLAVGTARDRALGGTVEVRDEAGATRVAEIEPDGRFTFRDLVPGMHRLSGAIAGAAFRLTPVLVA